MAFEWTDLLPLAGGLLGAAGSQDQQQTQSKTPWSEAVPWMRNNLQTGQDLQRYYQQTPFNQQQKTGYQNLYNTLDTQRQTNGNMMDFANRMATSQYQRANRSGDGVGPTRPAQTVSQGAAPFVRDNASQGYGLIDWDAQNPYKNGTIKAQPTQAEQVRGLLDAYTGSSGNDRGGDGNTPGGGSSLDKHNSVPGRALTNGEKTMLRGLLGPLAELLTPELMGEIGRTYNGYGQLGNNGMGLFGDVTGPGTIGVRDLYGSNESRGGYGNDFGGGRVDPRDRD